MLQLLNICIAALAQGRGWVEQGGTRTAHLQPALTTSLSGLIEKHINHLLHIQQDITNLPHTRDHAKYWRFKTESNQVPNQGGSESINTNVSINRIMPKMPQGEPIAPSSLWESLFKTNVSLLKRILRIFFFALWILAVWKEHQETKFKKKKKSLKGDVVHHLTFVNHS